MKANELMVGDYVMVNDIEHTHPLQVTELFMKSGTLYATLYWDGMPEDAMPETLNADVDKVLPIPLTPEILEKNGWKSMKNGSGDFILTNPMVGSSATITKTINGYEMSHGAFNGLGIHYIHQLQHALRLCGIEKTIEL